MVRGVTNADGTHDYVLLSVGDQSLHNDGARLTTLEIFEFLYDQFLLNPKHCFVGYYLKYDFTHWFRELPEERARRLFTEQGKQSRIPKTGERTIPFPVNWKGWDFDMLGMKRFMLRPSSGDNNLPWLYICDTGPFFQSSFLKAIDPESWPHPICTPEEFEILKQGKAQRANAKFDAKMIEYNVHENRILAKLCETLDGGFRQAGFNLQRRNYFGPGQVASLWLKQKKIGKAPDRENKLELALRASYYGGRFEIFAHGPVGTVYEYDINSAYPSIIQNLPAEGGEWTYFKKSGWNKPDIQDHEHVLLHVKYNSTDKYVGPFPHREPGGHIMFYPLRGAGWYWKREFDAAQRMKPFVYEIIEGYAYEPPTGDKPLASIAQLYENRLKAGKNTPQGKAFKLTYNSPYGKMAQSVGTPQFANSFYASLITSGTRALILDAIATHPRKSNAVLMIATDGVYFDSPHPSLDLDKETLGWWDAKVKQDMCLFKPGVYWHDETGLRSRGFSADAFAPHREKIMADWNALLKKKGEITGNDWPVFTIKNVFGFVSPALALSRGKWDTCGKLEFAVSRQSSDAFNKRVKAHVVKGMIRSSPHEGIWGFESTPYNKSFGKELEICENEELTSPDFGTCGNEISSMIMEKD